MADIFTVIDEVLRDDQPIVLARNPMIQFGTGNRRYLGAEFLPERPVTENQFTEDKIVYFSIPANDATRYSEPQLKEGQLVGSFDVKLGEIDIARQLTGKDFDNIRKIAKNNPDQAKAQLIAWLNTAVNLALVEKHEIQRWQALVNGAVTIQGTDGKSSTVAFRDPPGHRITVPSGTVAAPTGWYGTEDPMEAIFAMKVLLASKGYEVARIIGDTDITSAIATNQVMQQRLGSLTVNGAGFTSRVGLVDKQALDNYLINNFGLPPIEEYNLTYRTQTSTGFFKPRGSLVFIATTGRSETIDLGDAGLQVIEDTLGYYAIGIAVGEDLPGRVIRAESRNLKPIGLYSQGFATSFPVPTEVEAVATITVPKPTQ